MRLRTVGVSLTGLSCVWLAFIAVLLSPRAQIALVTLHWVRWPLFADFASPERYGFAVGRVRNFYIDTPDGARLGAWLVLANTPFARLRRDRGATTFNEAEYDAALNARPVVLYFHGNAATRAASVRTQVLRSLMAEDASVLIIDYRGFADSSRQLPTEAGLAIDARAAWDWLACAPRPSFATDGSVRTRPSNIVVMAQSLGTGVAVELVGGQLARQGIVPRALALVAPFTSIAELLETYKVRPTIACLADGAARQAHSDHVAVRAPARLPRRSEPLHDVPLRVEAAHRRRAVTDPPRPRAQRCRHQVDALALAHGRAQRLVHAVE